MTSRRRRIAGVVGTGALAGAALLAGAAPAGATTEAHGVNSLSFVNSGGSVVTCTVYDDALHKDDRSVTAALNAVGSDCAASISGAVSFRDRHGEAQQANGSTYGSQSLRLGAANAYSPITTRFDVTFIHCISSQCTVSVSANPK